MKTKTLSLFHFEPPNLLTAIWHRLATTLRRALSAPPCERPDAATLRDLGIDSSEWPSVLAEASRRAPRTRRRVAP
jgi:succinylarginine dihydrolase